MNSYVMTGITVACINNFFSFFGILAHLLVEYSLYTYFKNGDSVLVLFVMAMSLMEMHNITYFIESSKHCVTLYNSLASLFVTPAVA